MKRIDKLLNDYLRDVKMFKKKGTYDYELKECTALKRFFEHYEISVLGDLNENTIHNMVEYFNRHTLNKNNSINKKIDTLYRIIGSFKLVTNLPPKKRLPSDTKSIKPIADCELKMLISSLNENNNLNSELYCLAVFLLLDTGVRFNELANIRSSNVCLKNRSILLETTKNGKQRTVRFGKLSHDYVFRAMKKNSKYLTFNYLQSKKLDNAPLRYFFDVLCPVKKITPHRLRKTFATQLLKHGCPITTIQKLLGHSDIKTTMIYLEVDNIMIENDYLTYYPY